MFLSEGGYLLPSKTENESPCAWLTSWYGSCPIITTFTSLKSVYLKALNIFSFSGKITWFLYSSSKKVYNFLK